MGWFKFFIQDKTVQNLLTSFVLRSEQSREKHNNTIDQVDKPITQWVQEALEEAQDLCVYLQKGQEVRAENTGLN